MVKNLSIGQFISRTAFWAWDPLSKLAEDRREFDPPPRGSRCGWARPPFARSSGPSAAGPADLPGISPGAPRAPRCRVLGSRPGAREARWLKARLDVHVRSKEAFWHLERTRGAAHATAGRPHQRDRAAAEEAVGRRASSQNTRAHSAHRQRRG